MVRVLVVDDSAAMRALIRATLQQDPAIAVVGEAADPLEARQLIKTLDPDVVTLDVEMPNMNGLDFLERLMRLRPTPVVMVSTLTGRGAQATLEALEIGAVDCVSKVAEHGNPPLALLNEKVKAAAEARPRARAASPPQASSGAGSDFVPDGRVVAIGASTGGVEALITILGRFPANCPPTLVTQHMPPGFTRSFAERLNRSCAPEVAEAEDGEPATSGRILIAPGGLHLELAGPAAAPRCRVAAGPLVNGHRPSVDVLFESVARVAGRAAVGAILTGMGRDGAQGLLSMRQVGADTVGQDENTSVVFGMPRAAAAAGAVAHQLPLGRIAERILQLTNARTAKDRRPCLSPAP